MSSSIFSSTALPPSITIFNTAYDRPWSDEETRMLNELVGQQQIVHHRNNTGSGTTIRYSIDTKGKVSNFPVSNRGTAVVEDSNDDNVVLITIDSSVMNPFKIDWTPISMKLGRVTTSLIKQYNVMKKASYKHGPFTNSEDVHIIRRYLEWKCVYKDNAKSGIWSLLERELNRKDKRISERWRHVLCKRLGTLVELDAENNIVDPLKALALWIRHQDETVKLSTTPSLNGNDSTSSSSKNGTISDVDNQNGSLLKKRAYSVTESVISTNSVDSRGSHRSTHNHSHQTNNTTVTIDSTMNDINYILQSLQNEEYSNHSVLSLESTANDGLTFGGSIWNTIDNEKNPPSGPQEILNNTINTELNTNNVTQEDYAFSSSVWTSISTSSATKRTKKLARWTDEQDERLRQAVSLYPRDWVKISDYMGIDASSSKCRKRWARLQIKYQQTLSNAIQDATDFSVSDVEHTGTALAEGTSNNTISLFQDNDDEEDEMELYRDLQTIEC